MIIPFIPQNAIISRIVFSIGKLELWEFPFSNIMPKNEYLPPYRTHLIGRWFWRKYDCNE